MPAGSQLNALIRKNILIMKRNVCQTAMEILFPIFLMILVVGVRKGFKVKNYPFDTTEGGTDDSFIQSRGTAYPSLSEMTNLDYTKLNLTDIQNIEFSTWNNIPIRPMLPQCLDGRNEIGIIAGKGKKFPEEIKTKILSYTTKLNPYYATVLKFKEYSTVQEMEEYVRSDEYGVTGNKICMGIFFDELANNKYNYSLHYFDSYYDNGITDVPSNPKQPLDEFQLGQDLESYSKYEWNSYNYIQKILYEYIIKSSKKLSTDPEINIAMAPQKYDIYHVDPFGDYIGYIIPFFIVIAYMCPLCLYVFRIVNEKETRAKEGMKIMGMGEGIYFLSYFIHYFMMNIIYSVINSAIIKIVFEHIPYIYLLGLFWMYGMNIFALIFFFQSFIDKTRVALILTVLIYFVMFFMFIAVLDENISKSLKMFVSVFPPVGVEMGVIILGYFESRFRDFKQENCGKIYLNYSVNSMYIMFVVDFFIYLFLGFYLQNIVSHDFGIKRPFYFLFTKTYWCPNSKTKQIKNLKDVKTIENLKTSSKLEDNSNFQSEDLYKDKTKKDDVLKICKIMKTFDDKKTAVNGVSFNLYKDEIFALLGHNGAGKSTLISMLSGLYQATSGEAYYDGMNILEGSQMDIFRTKLGICPQHDVLFDDLTIREHLSLFCYFKGVPKDKIESEIDKTLEDFRIADIQNIVAKNLSAGQRRKLSISIAIIGGSEVIFLDEPSSGMDITSRRNLWEILKRCTENKIIILTTHYMEEASVLGNRIGIISEGKMKCIGSPLFLIERFGKYMSINIIKKEGADNEKIIEFFKERTPQFEKEILSEEIMFRIPKNPEIDEQTNKSLSINSKKEEGKRQKFAIKEFFKDLDENMEKLQIKSYSAAMPTLEDVFLNVAADEKSKIKETEEKLIEKSSENDKILFEDNNYQGKITKFEKFNSDLRTLIKKRLYQIFRDLKSFFLEILCPIILVIIGLAVSQVKIFKETEAGLVDMKTLVENNHILYAERAGTNIYQNFLVEEGNITSELVTINDGSSEYEGFKNFMNKIFEEKNENVYGSAYFTKFEDSTNINITFFEILNSRVRHGVLYYTSYFLNQIAKKEIPDIDITFTLVPLPRTADLETQSRQTNNYTLVFFVNVAFSLIPANFITLIIKERVNNSKHLMKVSGISLFAYWMSNYIFELVKYYIAGGINMLLIYAFDYFPVYFYVLYLLYGPAMISFTYLLSFVFSNESGAQNGVILLNFLFGALGSSVVLMFRALDTMINVGKGLAYAFRLIPSFSFGYGFNQLLNSKLLLILDHPDDWTALPTKRYISLEYAGTDALYLGIEAVVCLLIMAIIEITANTFKTSSDKKIQCNVNDSMVQKEIDKANQEEEIGIKHENGDESKEVYSVKVKNLHKEFTKSGCCSNEKVVAIKNLSFCIEYGECFGLLGVNGAGKTTTFKCLTQEHTPSNGSIFINGIDISHRFEEVRDMFGYCPQFDAIFEYMTVYENLQFYAKIKGVKEEKLDTLIKAMIDEMSLKNYTNKISGKLSGGNKRKLSVAISMICNPPIILLDEPSTGMDPEARRFMWAVIHKISTKRKKSSVIMTTHSMDEAETLCRRMGIMVNGEFVCLGSSQYIKEKYGYGFEIDVRIKPLNEDNLKKILHKIDNRKEKLNMTNIKEFLINIGKEKLYDQIASEKIGKNIYRDLNSKTGCNVSTVINWSHYLTSAMKMISHLTGLFDEIILSEFIENNFLFKIKKGGDNQKTIGFLFGLLEEIKDDCQVTEYSIQQTSLEQIFNQFAASQSNNAEKEIEKKHEILITKEFTDKFIC